MRDAVSDPRQLDGKVNNFINVIRERAGLLIARAEGTYAFSHLTFQEYLAALAIAGRDDYVENTLRHTADEWWREVIRLLDLHRRTVDQLRVLVGVPSDHFERLYFSALRAFAAFAFDRPLYT